MKHRHLEIDRAAAPEDLPSSALVDLLARGDLADWRPVAAAIAREPRGALAERVLRLVDAFPAYGASPLFRGWIQRCRARAEGAGRPVRSVDLAGLRRSLNLTQVQLASRLGMSQSDLSKLERRRDVRVSTLRSLATGLGGSLGLVFRGPGGSAEIRIGQR